jgi:transcriptional regulator with XRE-family HTH domain
VPPKINPKDKRELGEALRSLRETAGLTQEQAAERIGIRAQFVSEVERAERGVSWDTTRAMLRAYGATLTNLAKLIDD